MGRVNHDTDFPMAVGVIVGYSGLDISLANDYDWAEALVKAVDNTSDMPDDRVLVDQAVAILLGVGKCSPSNMLTRLRVRPTYE